MDSAVEVDGDAKILAAGFPDGGNTLQNCIDLIVGIHHLQFFGCVHLDGLEAGIHLLLCGLTHIGGTVTADPGIDLHLIPAGSAHQLIDRCVEHLALDVPQRLINAGQCAHQHTAAAVKTGTVDGGPNAFNVSRIGTDQVIPVFLNTGKHCLCVTLQNCLTPTGDAFIGHDFYESPAGTNEVCIDRCDFHSVSPYL